MENNNEERFNEWVNETQEGIKQSWVRDNIKELMSEFLEDNVAEFNIFLENNIIDDVYDIEYWSDVFCKEEQEEKFYEYCEEQFNNYCDIEKTNRSLKWG